VGHIRLGRLPRTRKWREVVALIAGGAGAAQIANAAIRAAEAGLRLAPKDAGVRETVWLLMQLPHAARGDDFPSALWECGIQVVGLPTLMELTGAFTDAIDASLANNRGRTDLGEMAQMAGAETLVAVVGEHTRSLYESGPEEVQRAVARLFTVKRFGTFTRRFFARLTFKCLDYFLSRVLSDLTGEGRCFTTLAQQAEFTAALETYCQEAAVIVERFAGDWFSKENWGSGQVSREAVVRFTGGAMSKLLSELRQRADADGH
jgi:hypothetical protein